MVGHKIHLPELREDQPPSSKEAGVHVPSVPKY
jgi:hypothetical protein